MAGTLVISTLSDGTNSTSSTNCIQGSAKAWVRFNASATINAAFNVSSVTKRGTGKFTLNYTTPFADANYSIVGATNKQDANEDAFASVAIATVGLPPTTTASYVSTASGNSYPRDNDYNCFAVFR